ncbi:hypothetical protein UFOVP176_40 [uncultured Caudovirales phage]|uniref:Uncharacterized protein n=1 Tax=uncultured Caudovirales phage TaxID=2100421 RepID=A0A6J7WF03_9CAUD|nr:hypothetical protein UFOVP176_40 [uncultured Caudovirales phage]
MHCSCCDRLLTEFEATRRNANTFQFIDLCKVCFEDVKPFVPTIDRADLITEQDLDEDPDNDDLDTDFSLEDCDTLISFKEDSVDSWE